MTKTTASSTSIELSGEERPHELTPEQHAILRRRATEPPGSSRLLHEKRSGRYLCAGCGQALFGSDAKYDSGSGWPSFFQACDGAVATVTDCDLPVPRTEVLCVRCGGHLGHVFDDGPLPTGQRWCINGGALLFDPLPDDEANGI